MTLSRDSYMDETAELVKDLREFAKDQPEIERDVMLEAADTIERLRGPCVLSANRSLVGRRPNAPRYPTHDI